MVDLAWAAFSGDSGSVTNAVAPHSPLEKITLAGVFIQHGLYNPARDLIRSCGAGVSSEDRITLISELVNAGAFEAAQELSESKTGVLYSGGLTSANAILKDNSVAEADGFNWRPGQTNADIRFGSSPKDIVEDLGLEIDFSGDPYPGHTIVSRLVAVNPGTMYRISFEAGTTELYTGGPPVVSIRQRPGTVDELARSAPFPAGTGDLVKSNLDFKTSSSTHAIDIVVSRQKCDSLPCPIFGKLQLKHFKIEELPSS